MRNIVILLLVFGIGLGAYFILRDDGALEQVTEARVEQALLDNRVPPQMAECMAPRLVDELSLGQLQELEGMRAAQTESGLPLSTGEAMARLREMQDNEAVRTLVGVAGGCGFELMIQGR